MGFENILIDRLVNVQDEYKNNYTKHEFKCDYCGKIILTTPHDVRQRIKRRGELQCEQCARKRLGEANHQKAKSKGFDNLVIDKLADPKTEYINTSTRYDFICDVCGKVMNTTQRCALINIKKNGFLRCVDCGVDSKRKGPKKEINKYCINCGKELDNHKNKYCSHECQHEYQNKLAVEKWKSGEKKGYNPDGSVAAFIRTYMFKKHDNKCQICGWGEINPFTNKIPLEVHHVDGDYKNDSEENLMLLCPNCHSLTDGYKGNNKGNGRESRRTSS